MKIKVLFNDGQELFEIEAVSFERTPTFMVVREDFKKSYPYTQAVHTIPYANVFDIVTEESRR